MTAKRGRLSVEWYFRVTELFLREVALEPTLEEVSLALLEE